MLEHKTNHLTMNSAVFFFLLALYAFQLVFADLYQDQINGFKTTKAGEIQKLINGGTIQQKKKTTYCQSLFEVPAKNTIDKVCSPALAKCGKDAKCSTTEVAACRKQVQFIVDNVEKCIKEKSN